jgi:hypothetical protein
VALAIDQSASMRGFAATQSITSVIGDAERAIRDVTHGSATYYALGETARRVPEADLYDQTRYTQGAADLRVALEAQELRDADVLVVVTDGQPTAAQRGASLGLCTPAGTQVISDLHDWFATRVDAGTAVWIVLEKVPFAGRFFLNCKGADKVPEIAGRLGKRLQCDSRECSYMIPKAPPQSRALVGIVLAKSPYAETASALVEAYLRGHRDATTVRLHHSTRDRYTVDRVTASLVGARTSYTVKPRVTEGEPPIYAIPAHCPQDNPDMVVRVCVRLRAANPPPGQPLARMDPPAIAGAQTVRTARTVADWLELPSGQSLEPAVIPRLNPSWHECASLWPGYLERADPGHHANDASSSCTGGDGIEVHELITACSCRAQRPRRATEISFVQGYRSTDDTVQRALSDHQLAADSDSWFDQPDRVNGLSELVQLIAAPRTADPPPHTVLRLVLDVDRP